MADFVRELSADTTIRNLPFCNITHNQTFRLTSLSEPRPSSFLGIFFKEFNAKSGLTWSNQLNCW